MEKHRFFSFYPRRGIIYVRFWLEDRLWSSGKSTGFKIDEREDAEFAVRAYLDGLRPTYQKKASNIHKVLTGSEWHAMERFFHELRTLPFGKEHVARIDAILLERKLREPTSRQHPTLIPFLEDFWDFEKSQYVKGRQSKDHRISRRHCYDCKMHVRNHWKKFFPIERIDEIGLAELESFAFSLKSRGLKGKTINNVMNPGLVALKWAFERDMISKDPTKGYGQFAVKNDKRGVLTPAEAKSLFQETWSDERARLGNLLAATCGLRSGEVLALKYSDLSSTDGKTYVARSWNSKDLFTDPKWGSFRDTSIDQKIRDGLLELAKESSFFEQEDFLLFHGKQADRPRDSMYLLDALREQLLKMNPDPEYWKVRKVDFHSWRHFFTSRMAERLDEPTLMKATGHKTKDAFDEYANHLTPDQFQKVRKAQDELFQDLLDSTSVQEERTA